MEIPHKPEYRAAPNIPQQTPSNWGTYQKKKKQKKFKKSKK